MSACSWVCRKCSSASIQGFGGSVRAVRLLGVRPAMQLMLTGRPVRADKAARIGLVDRLVGPQELDDAAREMVLHPPAPHRPPLVERLLSLGAAAPRSSSGR